MKRSGVYCILHWSGRRYIGSSINMTARWVAHRGFLRRGRHQNSHLQRAWDKYGPGAFVFYEMELVEAAGLIEAEQRHIDSFPFDDLFNQRRDARSNAGVRHTPEAKARMRAAQKGKIVPAATRAAALAANLGRKASAETKRKMIEFRQGRSHSAEARALMSAKANSRSPEHLNAISKALSKTWRAVDPNGNTLEITNLTAFARDHGLNASDLYGARHFSKGWSVARAD